MIKRILTYYAKQMDEYLRRFHHQPEGLAEIGFVGNGMDVKPNKVLVSLACIEREASGGITAPVQRIPEGYARLQPSLTLNLNVVLAAVYEERRYAESLSVLSDTLSFIQSTPKITVDGTDYTIEIVNVSTQDMNNIWTLLGGQYYPSVVCKIRRLVIDTETMAATGQTTDSPIVEI